MNRHLLYIIGGSVLLSSCNIYSNYQRPANLSTDSLYRDTTTVYNVVESDTINFGNTPWQEVFTDTQLQDLINKALAQNTNMREAELTIRQAEAGLMTSRLAFLPSLSLAPQGTVSTFDMNKATKTYTLPLQASWQIDAFGQLRNAKKQAEASHMLAKASKQATRTSIIASVANMYYTLQMLDEQLKVTKATSEIWKKNVAAMEAMFQAGGMTNAAAVSQAKANLYQIQTTIPTLEKNITETENGLCRLLHEAPHPIARAAFDAESFPGSMSAGVPMQLLSNRPDVRIAELQLASAFYATNQARSAFYPQITIGGNAGWTNSAGSAIINPPKFIASAVASLVQPLFMKGQLRANLKVAKAQQEAAQLRFEQALIDAGAEVSNALKSYQSALLQEDSRKKQVKELENAVMATDYLFTHGNTTSYLEKLTAQQSLLQAQLSLISDKFEKMQAAISLYQALGGGRDN